ncbi:hypothetical protein N802_03905 [Knoellia sinensis KCTC 19936]|uniref:Uncharacterized protein n=1 Tax=Knoellia sinensis KCTC 19936 TaxID=1385520 RepID=A0A0A0J661_9MICO|nr:hypothetical protein [Knoellia sinensis]KGN31522.1 hypothetical protein N802_03905 [Knoellia sinensis KCTC 19936]
MSHVQRPGRVLPGWAVFVLSASAFWVVGFLPWIVGGMRLPSSPAWPTFPPNSTPLVVLPFGEYQVLQLFVSSVIGGTAALVVARLSHPHVRHPRLIAAFGAVVALVVSVTQTLLPIRPALAPGIEAKLLLTALIVTVLVSALVGLVVGSGVAKGSGWPWLLGGAVAASLAGSWFADVVMRGPEAAPQWVVQVAQWSPWISGVLLGLVLAVFGFRPMARLLGWAVALGVAWVMPSLLTAAHHAMDIARRSPLRRSDIREVLDAGRDVFVQSLLPGNHLIGPLVLAVVIGVVGSVGRDRLSS